MKLYNYLMTLALAAVALSSPIQAAEGRRGGSRNNSQETVHEDELNNKDTQIVKTFLKSKAAKGKDGEVSNLTVSGDVRTEWRHMNEVYKKEQLRGGNATEPCDKCLPVSRNDFDVELNLRFEYVLEKAWAAAHLQFDNPMGVSDNDCCCDTCNNCSKKEENTKKKVDGQEEEVKVKKKAKYSCKNRNCSYDRFHGSGNGRNVDLKRAYMGYNIYTKDDARFDVEAGRRKMYDLFESELQFLSRFDGIVFEYSDKADIADWYVKLAGFVIDERTNHLGWAMEAAMFNIADSDLDIKYSLIDWQKRGRSRCRGTGKCCQKETCSEGSCKLTEDKKPAEYGKCACLDGSRNPIGFKYLNSQLTFTYHLNPEIFNRQAEVYGAIVYNHLAKQANKEHRKRGVAGYVGLTIGKVKREGDWSLDMQYQYVQDYAIAFDDQAGICLGDIQSDCCGGILTPGYKGVKIEGLYAITDHLSLDSIVEYASSSQHAHHQYWKFELEAIYAF